MSLLRSVSLRALFLKEVRRFAKVWMQTVFSPLITTSLYFLVFGIALGDRMGSIDMHSSSGDVISVSYMAFVIPGLMMLAMISNSFLNTSSSLFQSKINGTITDILVAPLGTVEILIAYVAAASIRGLIVGVLVWLIATLFVGVQLFSLLWILYFSIFVCVSFALLGLIIALWAQKFDHLAIIPSFVLTPMTFLGGVFYSIEMLPEPWSTISLFNPILYMVNGLRYGLLGGSDVSVLVCAACVFGITLFMIQRAWLAFEKGFRLRA